MKKILTSGLLGLFLISCVSFSIVADQGSKVSAKFTTNKWGNGGVDGSVNGWYYSLTPGKVHFNCTDSNMSNAHAKVSLWRSVPGTDICYGERYMYDTGNYIFDINASSSYYYLEFRQTEYSTVNKTYYADGRMHDHRP